MPAILMRTDMLAECRHRHGGGTFFHPVSSFSVFPVAGKDTARSIERRAVLGVEGAEPHRSRRN